ncbi:MAG: DUF2334 domain-containing protein [Fibrobacteraceae bacterium]|nr:DUF2334 domain-containing protein [Fibrobacteraceae bacterium]
MRKRFLLSFHDFSVWNYQAMLPILDEIKELVGKPFSILVIPCTEGADNNAVAGFRQALAKLHDEGFELALHGYKHKAEFSQGRSYAGLVAMNITNREAEFAGLSKFESGRLLQQAALAWNELFHNDTDGAEFFHPAAFVPPTWYSNKFLPQQVHAQKMLYEGRATLTTVRNRRVVSFVASFAGIPKCSEKMAFAFANFVLKMPLGIPRIALHPTDFPRLENPIRDLLRTAISLRKIVGYGELN